MFPRGLVRNIPYRNHILLGYGYVMVMRVFCRSNAIISLFSSHRKNIIMLITNVVCYGFWTVMNGDGTVIEW